MPGGRGPKPSPPCVWLGQTSMQTLSPVSSHPDVDEGVERHGLRV